MAKFTLKQIAAQSGLSLATIDRALHQRGNVHATTQHRIQQAIADLELMQKAGLAREERSISTSSCIHLTAFSH